MTTAINLVEFDVKPLYANYKRVPRKDIQRYLKKIKIVEKTHKGVGSKYGYYELSKKRMKEIIAKPRGVALQFQEGETGSRVKRLVEMKTIVFLTKSSSRFFLKSDIGEVFDQIDPKDLESGKIAAICINSDYQSFGPSGEEFLLSATLFQKKK